MKKIFVLLCGITLLQYAAAISLGDQLNQNIAVKSNSPTSTTKLLTRDTKSSVFQNTSSHGSTKYTVNNKTGKVYSISWQDKQAVKLADILGTKYYPEFQSAAKKPVSRVPRRGIEIDNGDLVVSQFGSMLAGFHGSAAARSMAP